MKIMVSVVAVAALSASVLGSAATSLSGIVVLDPSAQAALTLSGSSMVQCPAAYVCSSDKKSVTGSGSALIDTPSLCTFGGCSFSGSSRCTGTTTHTPAPYADPLAGLKIPTSAGVKDLGTIAVKGGSKTIQPGYYSGGISVSGGAKVTFAPGVYFVGGKGLSVSSSSISGQGVCIVMLSGGVAFSGGTTATLTPPTTGAMAGVVIAQPVTNTSKMALSGGTGISIGGAIYAPGAHADLSGSSSVQGKGPQFGDSVVFQTLTLSGSGLIKIGGQTTQQWIAPLPVMPLFD